MLASCLLRYLRTSLNMDIDAATRDKFPKKRPGPCLFAADPLSLTSSSTNSSRNPCACPAIFCPILRETPKEAEIVSHRLMLRAGMMRQEAAGIYAFLPLGFRVLQKICQIVREEQNRSGAIELLMPTIQSAELWRESGRYEAYGKEMLRIKDRHEREMLYGPTNEEMITEIFRAYVRIVQGRAAQSLSHPVEIPRRSAPALRTDARPRILDEGCLLVRSRSGRRDTFLQQDVRRLSSYFRAHGLEIDPDARGVRADRRKPLARVHHPRADR